MTATLVRVPLPRDFAFDAVVRSHGWYDLPPFSYDRGAGVLSTRVDGVPASFRVRGGRLLAQADGRVSPARLRAAARRIFSLDLDLSAFDAALGRDLSLRRALRRGGGRMLRAPDAFEDAVKMLLTTNCSWEATRGMVRRLIELASPDGASFPRPEEIARFAPATLRARVRVGYRARALSRFARRAAAGRLDLAAWEDRERSAAEIRDAILAEDGFGPYAAEGLLRILGRHDFLALDSWVRMKYRKLHPGPKKKTDGSIARRYARFGDYRGLAMWLELTDDWHAE
ncbi:MAG TPA: Fe-S cluster assembly protein HesB [Thermoanaerobaculia bacterium]|jgi:N-glycosylase/DNA lyase|nr:Fe-S cluster assembly protein HesB [Thermoanaerobaculia bacterium]